MSMIERAPHRRAMAGFTLIEGVIVITLISVLAAVAGLFIVQPFSAARDISRRAELTDAAETALDRMTREIRLAVPNSVRLADTDSDGDNNALEFLRSSTGGRYRRLHAPGGGGETLDPTLPNGTFDVLGGIHTPDDSVDKGGAGRDCADRATAENDCLVITNTATAGFDAYDKDNVAAITDVHTGNDTMTFNAGAAPAFPAHSSNQRFQVLDTVVSYICQNGRIDRFFDYGLQPSQPQSPGGTPTLLASDVMACNFAYESGAGQRHGLVTIDITIQRDGETVRLIDQAHVVNVP
jgi:MSHA biogenesis protein MshO